MVKRIFMLEKIISGGQTGVDRAALDVGLKLGISIGGYCPKQRIAEDGVIASQYPLIETISPNYPERTKLNIEQSDATLIIIKGKIGKGSALTVKTAQQTGKPYFLVDLSQAKNYNYTQIISWLKENNISTLNIAGSRESSNPGIYKEAYLFLEKLLKEISSLFCSKFIGN